MKKSFFFLATLIMASQQLFAQLPTLGTYASANISASGGNGTVTPTAAPTNTASITAATSTQFKGLLHVNTTTGVVTITNAHPAGNYTITVKAFNGANSVTSSFGLVVGNTACSQGLFVAGTNSLSMGNNTQSVAIGDFNNDGKQDIISANDGSNTVSIRLGNGIGGFGVSSSFSVGTNPRSIAVSDFNGDGYEDVITANYSSNNVSIRLGNGLGGFTGSTNITVGTNPYCVATGDFNGDGKIDFVSANYSSNNISIRLGDGSGNFSITSDITVGINPRFVAISDFNNDGNQDIASVNQGSDSVAIFLGDGNGIFNFTTNISAGDSPTSLSVGDFNTDGKVDIAIANGDFLVVIRLGNGTGGFTNGTNVTPNSRPSSIGIGDFNADGKLDLAITHIGNIHVAIRLGDGQGGFTTAPNAMVGNNQSCIAIGDFNSDGIHDFVASGNNNSFVLVRVGGINEVNILGNNTSIVDGDLTPSLTDSTDLGGTTSNLRRTYTIQNSGNVALNIHSIFLSGTDTSFFKISGIVLPALISSGSSTTFIVTFSPTSAGLKMAKLNILNNDCDESTYDFSIQGTGIGEAPTLGLYTNSTIINANGNTTLNPTAAPINANVITAYTTSSFKGLLQINPITGNVYVTNAHPAGSYSITVKAINGVSTTLTHFSLLVTSPPCSQGLFTPTQNLAITKTPGKITVGEFNSDGVQDLAIANMFDSSISIRLGNGTGGFTGNNIINLGSNPYSVEVGDFNNDGIQDFAATTKPNNLVIKLGDGNGNFTGTNFFTVGSGPSSLSIADFNNDGKKDIAVANQSSGNISIRLGDGTGVFNASPNVTVGNSPESIAVGDFNMDGKLDFVTANRTGNSISIRLGDGMGGFTGTSNLSINSGPLSVTIGDFNGDNKQDLAVSLSGTKTVSILLGDGLGNFNNSSVMNIGKSVRSIVTGDFNGDGKEDIAVGSIFDGVINIRCGNGTGGFSENEIHFNVGYSPQFLAVGDFNNDSRQDLAIAMGTSDSVSIQLGNVDEINILGNSISISDGDITPNVVDNTDFGDVSNYLIQNFKIENTGAVNLTVTNIKAVGGDSALFSIGHINLPSIIPPGTVTNFTVAFIPESAGSKTTTIQVFNDDCDEALYDFSIKGKGLAIMPTLGNYAYSSVISGGNIAVSPSTIPINVSSITAFAPINFKGQLQVNTVTGVVYITNAYPAGNYTITLKAHGILSTTTSFNLQVTDPNCSKAGFTSGYNIAVGESPYKVMISDFNNDGKQDFAVSNYLSNNISIRLGDGLGSFSIAPNITNEANPSSIICRDFNGDGNVDVACASYENSKITVFNGNGLGEFSLTNTTIVKDFPNELFSGDFNKDGMADLALLYGNNDSTISILLGNRAGGFIDNGSVYIEDYPYNLVIGDFNNDTKEDIAAVNSLGFICIRLGNGFGGFTGSTKISTGSSQLLSIILGDFNNDGNQDIGTSHYDSSILIRLGNGLGSFSSAMQIYGGSYPVSLTMADINGDGHQDIIAANINNNSISIQLANGSGQFASLSPLDVGTYPVAIAIADFNGDGRHDIITTNNGSNNVSIFLGAVNEINLQSNSTNIPKGDTTPNIADSTDFGIKALGSNTPHTFTIQNTGVVNLTVSNIIFSGADSASFTQAGITLPAIISAGSSRTFKVNFIPKSVGLKTTVVKIINNDCDESIYDFTVKGVSECEVNANPNIWLGNSADWNLVTNWSLGFVPLACTKVVVNNGVPFMPEITEISSVCYSLTLNNGATVLIKASGKLFIAGNEN